MIMLSRRNFRYGRTESLADFAITKICKWMLILCIVNNITTSNGKYGRLGKAETVILRPFVTSRIAAIESSAV